MSVVELVAPLHSTRVSTSFNQNQHNTLWISMSRAPLGDSQKFSLDLLREGAALYRKLQSQNGYWVVDGSMCHIDYAVLRSENPEFFSLGGDLAYFRDCIRHRNAQNLRAYAMLCVDMVFDMSTKLNDNATTVTLVQGRALGGGFEAALSSDYIIAEEQSEFGFPEILFGLFPCTGGMSLLARRVGVYQAERMMNSGRIYSASELKDMGIVDEVCPRGRGAFAVEKFIEDHNRHRYARMALQRARRRLTPIDYRELETVVSDWVEVAMSLQPEDLRVMDMLIQMQGARASTG